jgi:hypothetical protein
VPSRKNPPVDKLKARPDQPERRRHDQRPLPHFAGRRGPVNVHGSGAAEGRSDRWRVTSDEKKREARSSESGA